MSLGRFQYNYFYVYAFASFHVSFFFPTLLVFFLPPNFVICVTNECLCSFDRLYVFFFIFCYFSIFFTMLFDLCLDLCIFYCTLQTIIFSITLLHQIALSISSHTHAFLLPSLQLVYPSCADTFQLFTYTFNISRKSFLFFSTVHLLLLSNPSLPICSFPSPLRYTFTSGASLSTP